MTQPTGVRLEKTGTAWFAPPSTEELARRQELVAKMLANRAQRVIRPLSAADLVALSRREDTGYGHDREYQCCKNRAVKPGRAGRRHAAGGPRQSAATAGYRAAGSAASSTRLFAGDRRDALASVRRGLSTGQTLSGIEV